MKLAYIAATMIARGSDRPMEREEENNWLLLVLLLFFLFNALTDGVLNGTVPINGRVPIHAGLRGAAVRSLFENMRLRQAIKEGYTEGRRVLGIAEHCEDSGERPGCVDLAALGWMPIEKLVPIGAATCLDNCNCHYEFRKRIRI